MARFPRTLGDALAAQAEAARNTRTSVLSVDPLAPITLDNLGPDLTGDLDGLRTDLDGLGSDLAVLDTQLDGLGTDLSNLSTELTSLNDELGTVDGRIEQAINDNNAIPITNDRFTEDSLSIWPFINGTIPQGAFAPGAVKESDIADFSIAVKKFKSDRHHLY